jgi:hypothetical protein
MTKKNLKEQIMDSLHTPKDISENIKNTYLSKKNTPWYKSKMFYGLTSASLGLAAVFTLVLIPMGNNNLGLLEGANTDNAFAYQAATSIGLFNNNNSSQPSGAIKFARQPSKCVAEDLINYLPAVESALTGENLLTEITYDVPSEGYDTKVIITTRDLLGNVETLTMEYKEYLIEKGFDADDYFDDFGKDDSIHFSRGGGDKHDHDDHKRGHKHDDETEFLIQGTLTKGTDVYNMIGIREIEEEEGEKEQGMAFRYGLPDPTMPDGISLSNFVLVEQEIEGTETEYSYLIVENYLPVYQYSLEVERNEVYLTTAAIQEGYQRVKFRLHNEDGKTVIQAFAETNFERAVIIYQKEEDGSYTYKCPHTNN